MYSVITLYRQGICSSHLIFCLILNFIFGYCSRTCQIWKSPCTFFASIWWSCDHDVMGENFLLTKSINFGVNEKIILCWSTFAIEPIADFCPFWGYWPSKNGSRDHDVQGIKGEFVSLAKPIVFGTTGRIILCSSIIQAWEWTMEENLKVRERSEQKKQMWGGEGGGGGGGEGSWGRCKLPLSVGSEQSPPKLWIISLQNT